MNTVLMRSEVAERALEIARTGNLRAQREVARTSSSLRYLASKMTNTATFWNIEGSASGLLTSCATLSDGTSLWRICPTHSHCIALVAVMNDDLHVLYFGSEAEIELTERKLVEIASVDELITRSVDELAD
jgi:hypothetical protein